MLLAEGMLGNKGGKLDRDGLVELIKDIKKNTKLSDEDAAVIAASKVGDLVDIILAWGEKTFFSKTLGLLPYIVSANKN